MGVAPEWAGGVGLEGPGDGGDGDLGGCVRSVEVVECKSVDHESRAAETLILKSPSPMATDWLLALEVAVI